MLSPYKIPTNSHKRKQKTSNRSLIRAQMTSIDINRPYSTSNESCGAIEIFKLLAKTLFPKKSKLKGGEDIEINDEFSDEFLQNNNL